MRTALIVAGGDPPGLELDELPAADLVIAADSGLDHARAMQLRVDIVVGDMDSVSPLGLQWAQRSSVRIESHPPNKDATDLELALQVAVDEGIERLVVVGGIGGRLDHELATVGLLANDSWSAHRVELRAAGETVHVVRDSIDLETAPGSTVTLLAWGGPAIGVTTDGLQWPLKDHTLAPGSTLGISNVVQEGSVSVALTSGVVLVIQSIEA